MYRMYGIPREAGAGSGYVLDARYFALGRDAGSKDVQD